MNKHLNKNTYISFLFMIIISVVLCIPAHAATITVDTAEDEFNFFGPNGQCSLREAISAANSDGPVDSCAAGSGDDVIIFDESLEGATIVLDIAGSDENDNVTGDLDINGTGSLLIQGASTTARPLELPDPIIIDGNGTDRVIDVFSELTLFNVTIQNGGSVPTGGGIRTDTDVTLNLDTVTVTGNELEAPFPGASISGAGINASGPLNILFTIIAGNEASGPGVVASGGGIKYSGSGTTMNISRSIIEDNTVSSASGGFVSGGGIDVISSGDVNISDSRIFNNTAEIDPADLDPDVFGGAINFQSSGALTVTTSVVRGNVARIQGEASTAASTGRIFGAGISFMAGKIIGSEISNNTASSVNTHISGVGVHNAGNLEITNSTLSRNSAISNSEEVGGGGLFVNASSVTSVNNSTIAENSIVSDSGTSIGGGIENNGGSVIVSNSIIALNSADAGPDCSGTVSSDNFNLVGDDSDCGFAPLGDDIVNIDPVLGPLAENGADTQTHALLEGSPAIDMADSADPAGAGTCETEDQRGEMRPFDGDDDGTGRCDIGSFELQEADIVPGVGSSGGDSGCFLAASGSTISLSIYSIIPLMILIRRILSIKRGR